MKDIFKAPFITEIGEATANMYRQGWNERNAGNVSYLLDEEEVKEYLDTSKVIRVMDMNFCAEPLIGKLFLVTGTGKYFKNVLKDPETNLGIVRIGKDGKSAELLWGLKDGGRFTSEFPAHMMSHIARLKQDPNNRVIMHCHAPNIVAMSYIHELDEKAFTHTLWEMCLECVVVLPEGVGVLPWMLSGSTELGVATAMKMEKFRAVLWAQHGIYGSGNTVDEAFGLVETIEKAAQIYMLVGNRPKLNTITDKQIQALAEAYKVNYRKDFLDLE